MVIGTILIIPAVRNVNISIKKEHPSGWMGVLNVLQQVTDDIPQCQQNNDQRQVGSQSSHADEY